MKTEFAVVIDQPRTTSSRSSAGVGKSAARSVLRAARQDDVEALYEMALSTGGGFTNLPPDRGRLADKLARAAAAFSRDEDVLSDDQFFFVLEDAATGRPRGTCQIFSRVGSSFPFYSYRRDSFTKYSKELGRTVHDEMLTLSTDHCGCSEVGGLFLNPADRAAGAGTLLARSRYLFIQMHRARFADRTIAELRGAQDASGGSPFWDAIGGRFFGMGFREADDFNAVHGHQFIADLMPKHPIYTALLPESAVAVMGIPHQTGQAAQRMLEKEGFIYDRYVDIFDGGPTMTAATDDIKTVRRARTDVLVATDDDALGTESLVARGRLSAFRACYGQVTPVKGGVILDAVSARALGASVGGLVTHVAR